MSQFFKKIKNKWFYIAAFCLPAFLMFAVYLGRGVYPASNNSVLVLDLNGQYIYYFEAFRDAILDGKSLLYSFSRNLGGEMLGLATYYLISPFNIIFALFPKAYITEALFLISILKIGSAGLCFAIYLRISKGTEKMTCVIFGTLYAMSAYMVIQLMNLMWIDSVIIFPIVLLGLEKLFKKGRIMLFTLSLTFAIYTNFYIGYMICAFCLLYFLYLVIAESEGKNYKYVLKRLLLFALSGFLAVLCSAVILLPTYYSMSLGKIGFQDNSFIPAFQFTLFDMLPKMLPGVYDTVMHEGLPVIYSGTLTLFLIPIYFLCKKISFREKVATGVVFAGLIISFNISTLDMVWHVFAVPNCLNYRYSFAFIFMALVISCRAFKYIKEVDTKTLGKIYAILMFLVLLIDKLAITYVTKIPIWFSLISFSIYLLVLVTKIRHKVAFFSTSLLICILSFELIINTAFSLEALNSDVVFSSRTSYRQPIDELIPLINDIKKSEPEKFFRIEKTFHRTVNDPMALSYSGISHSSSSLNAGVLDMLHALGFSQREHWARYTGGTPISDSLMSIKYVLDKSDFSKYYNDEYKLIKSKKPDKDAEEVQSLNIYQNPYWLPLAFLTDAKSKYSETDLESKNPFEVQNSLMNSLLGTQNEQYFKEIKVDKPTLENAEEGNVNNYTKIIPEDNGHVIYNFKSPGNKTIYCYFENNGGPAVNLWLNNQFYDTYFENNTHAIISFGGFKKDQDISLKLSMLEDSVTVEKAHFVYLDTDKLKSAFDELRNGALKIEKMENTYIKGTVTVDKKDVLYTSIPYEKGWSVYVDGKKQDTFKIAGALLGAQMPYGTHTVELKFMPIELIYGALLSLAGFILLFIIYKLLIFYKVSEK